MADRISPGTVRQVDVDALKRLVPDGAVSDVARRMGVEHARRTVQRARSGKGISQGNAELIAEALGVTADSFLLPLSRADRRLVEFRRLARRAEALRRELGLPLDAYTHG